MCGTICLHPIYAFMAWRGTTLPVPLLLTLLEIHIGTSNYVRNVDRHCGASDWC
jgi:hypothetical protein